MPSMFRSPNDISSDSDSTSDNPDNGNDPSPAPLELQESATECLEDQPTRFPLPEGETSWVPDLPPQAHGAVMTASILEFYCHQRAAEILNQGLGNEGRYTRFSPEAIVFGKRIYEYQSRTLSSQGVLPANLEDEDMGPLRQNYRDGLDTLGRRALEDGFNLDPPARALSPFLRSAQTNAALFPRSRSVLRRLLPGRGSDDQTMPSIAQTMSTMRIDATTMSPVFESAPASFPLVSPSNAETSLFMSRYATEFTEIKLLGKGGYGRVYHVQNHVDGQQYAIKKIVLTPKRFKKLQEGSIQELEAILKEIRTLARLEHSNVVRYYGAWIERNFVNEAMAPSTPERVVSPARALIQDGPGVGFNNEPSLEIVFEEPDKVQTETDRDDGIVFEEPEKPQIVTEGDDGVVFGEDSNSVGKNAAPPTLDERNRRDRRTSQATVTSSHSKRSTVHSTGPEDEDDVEAIPREMDFTSRGQTTTVGVADEDIFTDGFGERETRLVAEDKKVGGPTVVLHIQMSLHPLSLATYLSPLPKTDSSITASRHCYHLIPSVHLMLAILGGVEYLHTKGIVHRDLKPGNIFLAESPTPISSFNSVNIHSCSSCSSEDKGPLYITPRIGDFGLVAEISGTDPVPPDTAHLSSLTSPGKPVGTEFYRPPIRTISVDEKLDVFALGILLFELLWKFNTRMERHMVLADLGKGTLPKDFANKAGSGGKTLEKCITGMVREATEKRYGCAKVRKCLEKVLEEGKARGGQD